MRLAKLEYIKNILLLAGTYLAACMNVRQVYWHSRTYKFVLDEFGCVTGLIFRCVSLNFSSVTHALQIKRKQDFVASVLSNRKIPFEEVDISDPLCTSEKNFMRDHSRPSGTDPSPLPPQIFNNDVYCGVTGLYLHCRSNSRNSSRVVNETYDAETETSE